MISNTFSVGDYTAAFSFDGHCLQVEWSPHVPTIRNHRKLRRFMVAYRAARDAFMAEVATVRGGNVLILDVAAGDVTGTSVAKPMAKH